MVMKVAGMLVLAATVSACSIDVNGAGVTTREEKTFHVTGRPDLTLKTSDGSIEIRSWDRNEIRLEIVRRAATTEEAEALEVTTTQDGNRIEVDARDDDRRQIIRIGRWVGDSVSYIVRVPRQLILNATTGDGSITVDDLAGMVTLASGDGSIRGARVDGDVSVRTGDGSIVLDATSGRVDLDTGDGSVRLSARLDALRVHTGDGSVTLDVRDGSTMAEDWSVETGDGSVSVSVPAQFSAEVDLRSGDGTVQVNGVTADGDESDRRRYSGRLGTGGRTLSARSGDGSITVRTR